MKKFALSVAACTLLATSLAGCGDANNQAANDRAAYDMNYVNDYRGADQDYAMNRSNRGDRGEGPITDMLTVDDRTTRTERHDSTHNVDDRTGSSWAYNNARDVSTKTIIRTQKEMQTKNVSKNITEKLETILAW
ncbi:hypothetical protein JCM19037_3719 [Geomicrobium sp. JCM 19037]|uniref:hypothetical protein n=1 Tax=Geomicrobium sp. JCM 19037 TaxID=1460634 RepID=UPI00045F4B33|nr:hypothetical protein [Geomicrobium sp. JCM 19037]GAK05238.1 hypothetical protein JCM19037_3719 [Geomicrobium sp. JCM 19037]